MTRSRKPNRRSSIYYSETDGYWHGWVYMGVKDDGSPDRRHRKAKTETVVTAKVQKLEDERSAGTVAKVGERLTVEAWMQTWLTQIAPRRVARSTLTSTYEPKVRRWIIPRLGRHYLDRLEPHHLDTFYMWLAEQDLKPNTILQIHRILARALKVAYQREKIKRNVTALVEAPTGEYTEIEPFALDDAQAILVAAEQRRGGTRWSVALAVGVRQAEALGLRWQYVDLNAGTIQVGWQLKRERYRHGCDDVAACANARHRRPCPKNCPKARRRSGRRHTCITKDDPSLCPKDCEKHARQCPNRIGGKWRFVLRKGVKPGRGTKTVELPLPESLVKQLRAHRKSQSEERLAAGEYWEDWDLVFCQPNGRPIEPHQDWQDWRSLLAETGVREARIHDARHTAATLLLAQGVDIRIAQQILGHSQLSQTQRYTHVSLAMAADAATRMNAALWPTATETATAKRKGERR